MWLVNRQCDAQEDDSTEEADLPAPGKGFVLITEGDLVDTLCHGYSNHGIAHKNDFCRLIVYIGNPVSILREGGVE